MMNYSHPLDQVSEGERERRREGEIRTQFAFHREFRFPNSWNFDRSRFYLCQSAQRPFRLTLGSIDRGVVGRFQVMFGNTVFSRACISLRREKAGDGAETNMLVVNSFVERMFSQVPLSSLGELFDVKRGQRTIFIFREKGIE